MEVARSYLGVFLLAAVCGLSGCAGHERPKTADGSLPAESVAQQDALVAGTTSLLTQTYVQIVAASAEAQAATTDRAIQEDSLRWRIHATNKVDAIRAIEDPRLRFVALWTLIEQLQASLTTGFGKDRFGAQHDIYVKALTELQARALVVAYAAFPVDVVNKAKTDIATIATSTKPPETPNEFAAAANKTLTKLISIPMSPVSGLEGVGNTPAAINRFTDQASDIGKIVERLPERTRWQMELFLLEAEETGAVARALKDTDLALAEVQALRKDFTKLVETVQKVPDQANAMLQEVLAREPALAQDLARIEGSMKLAKETVGSADQTVTSVNAALSSAQTALDGVRETLGDVDRSAGSIKSATIEVRGLMGNIEKLTGPPTTQEAPRKDDGNSYTPTKIIEISRNIESSAAELRALLAELKSPTQMTGVEQTASRIEAIISKALWGMAGLIVLFFASAIVYRRTTRQRPGQDTRESVSGKG